MRFNPRCVAAATTITCPTADLGALTFSVTAKAGAEIGADVPLPVRVVLDGTARATSTGRVTIAEPVALTAVDTQGDVSLATGASTALSAAVRNSGDAAINGVVLELRTVRGITSARHSTCVPTELGAACFFDTELAPGATYRLATPWQITASPAVWAPSQWASSFVWHTAQD
ncbi:hypothetical protein M1L60_10920 [Actinoplanes sp. TRM 88003]|uniref:Uncharacterized protein n=1 Tax=Paractinoplanes aksuensis TaxID=2939490 RepID=A0ABT1DM48_9ACTN|nr:hypothetical protein [Actinoplanes aksuensis]MCO8271105.1 hypothetical protein [Actinoplanes aksuensis]